MTATFSMQTLLAQNTSPYWSLNGNNNATLSHKFGTTNNVSLRFVTNNIERMKIHSSGNIGIGTTSPTQKLHVVGKGLFTTGLIVSGGGISGTNTSSYGVFGKSGTGIGVYGQATDTDPETGWPIGVGIGVKGEGGLTGVEGYAYTYKSGTGVYGRGVTNGVQGVGDIGVYGNSVGGDYSLGVWGNSANYIGVYGSGYTGVYGESKDGSGGEFYSESGSGISVRTVSGTYAGEFYGKVFSTGGYQTSDQNLKQNIQEFSDAMGIIHQLKPKHYEFKTDAQYAPLHLPTGAHYGLIAQELEAVLPNLVQESTHQLPASKIKRPKIENGRIAREEAPQPAAVKQNKEKEHMAIKAVNYTELIPILVKALQEQDEKMEQQQQQINELKELVTKLTNSQNIGTALGSGAILQNTPNPVRGSTQIAYSLPEGATRAQLLVTDNLGRTIKTIQLTTSGSVSFDTSTFSAGIYNYSLVIDNKTVQTRKMTVVK
jgi:hypothetical protein